MNNTDLKNISDILAGKKAVQVEVPPLSIVYLSIGILLAVLLGVLIANQISKN